MDKKKPDNQIQYMPFGMCIGLSIGVAIGAVMDNIPIGMCLGLGIGMCYGSALDTFKKAKNNESKDQNQED